MSNILMTAGEWVHKSMHESFDLSVIFLITFFSFFVINLLDIHFLPAYVDLCLPAGLLPSFLLLDNDVFH